MEPKELEAPGVKAYEWGLVPSNSIRGEQKEEGLKQLRGDEWNPLSWY